MSLNKKNSLVYPHSIGNSSFPHKQWTANGDPDSKRNVPVFFQNGKRNIINKQKRQYKRYKYCKHAKLITTKFLQNASIYVLNRIGNSRTSASKMFWILVFIIGAIGFLSQVGLLLNSYFDYPVVVDMDFIQSDSQEFPAVTLCNVNRVLKKYEDCVELGYSPYQCSLRNRTRHKIMTQSLSYTRKNTLPKCEYGMARFPKLNETARNWLYSYLSLSYDSRMIYGHQLDFIETCWFAGRTCYESWRL